MRCLLVVSVLVAAAGAASVSQSVSVGGSADSGGSVSVVETSSSIDSDAGVSLGTRSSFSSNRRESESVPARREPAASPPRREQAPTLPRRQAAPAPGGTSLLAAQAPVSGGVPLVPAIQPLRPIHFNVPSLSLGSSLGTRFNNRGASGVAPVLAGPQATLQQAANQLNAAMNALRGV